MSFYENTLVAKQDLPKAELEKIKEKYNDLINKNSGKVIKIDNSIIRYLVVKYKKLDTKNEYFKKDK